MANKVKSLLGGPGFYAVLALCVLAVGVGGYFLLFGEPAQTEAPTGPDTAASAPVEDLPEHEPVVETVPPEEPEEERTLEEPERRPAAVPPAQPAVAGGESSFWPAFAAEAKRKLPSAGPYLVNPEKTVGPGKTGC